MNKTQNIYQRNELKDKEKNVKIKNKLHLETESSFRTHVKQSILL